MGIASWLAVAVGLVTLVGYALRLRTVVALSPGSVPMAPGTAVAFVLAGGGLWLASPRDAGVARRRIGQGLALLVVLFGAAVLVQYAAGVNLGIDLLLFPDRAREWTPNGIPGRASPHVAAVFVVIGLAIALLDVGARQAYWPARVLVSTAAILVGVGLSGRAFGLDYLYGSTRVSAMALSTAVTLAVVTVGLLAARPERPPTQVFVSSGLGGVTARRLTPVVGAAVLLAGVLFATTNDSATAGARFGVTAASTVLVVTVWAVFSRTGRALDRVEREQQKLLATLRDQYAFAAAILEALPDGVIAISPDSTVIQVSPRWSEITGFTAADAVGRRSPYPWWPPERIQERLTATENLMTTAAPAELHTVIRRADGVDVEVLGNLHPVLDREGGVRMIVSTIRDLTELSRAEAEQRRQADQLTHFFNLSTDLICIAGSDGYFKRVNPAWEQTLGFTEAELTSRPYLDFIHPDDIERTARESMLQTTAGKKSISFGNRYRCRDGSYRWLEWNAIPQGDWVYAVARDTTEQRRAGADRARLAAIVDSTDDAIIGMTLDGTITTWNRAAERVYGSSTVDSVGQSIEVYFPDEAQEILQTIRRGDSVTNHDSVWVRADGTTVHIGVTISPTRADDGTVIGAASIGRDITVRRQIERDLAAARDEATAATAAKSSFLATMSHEIRTPMNAVIGLTGLLLDTELDHEQREFVSMVRDSGDALLLIINDILDFSKIEAGQLELEDEPFDVRDCIDTALALVAVPASVKNLELVGHVDPSCPPVLRGDLTRLRQILVNLLSNAIKFTNSGEVEVAARADPVGDAMRLEVAVRDSGIGIPADRIDRLFRSFSQVDASTTRVYGGTGLGLAISHRLAGAMGGDLTVVSEAGVGSTFTLTALLHSSADALDQPRAPAVVLANRLALVVDDNATNRTVLRAQLTGWGMHCVDVGSAAEALQLFAATRFDVGVLDMHMPGMNGAELAAALRQRPGGPDLPLVLLSSVDWRPDADQRSLFDASLTKPARASSLYAALTRVLGKAATPGAEPPNPAPSPTPGPKWYAPLRVLLAEDNPVNQRVANVMLSKLGHHVDTVANGSEAVQAVQHTAYDVVIMDVQMPVMDGLEATRLIRAELPADRQPPIIAMTASVLVEDRAACRAAGMNDYLAKPVRMPDLTAALSPMLHPDRIPATTADSRGSTVESDPGAATDQRRTAVHERFDEFSSDQPMAAERAELARLAATFNATSTTAVGHLTDALLDGNAAEVAIWAHSLRGSAANISATSLAELVAGLETDARGGELPEPEPALRDIRHELDLLQPILTDLIDELSRPDGPGGPSSR